MEHYLTPKKSKRGNEKLLNVYTEVSFITELHVFKKVFVYPWFPETEILYMRWLLNEG